MPWLSSVPHIKVFGFILHPSYSSMIQLNWEDQLSKFNKTLYSWADRAIDSVFDRAEIVRTFALSKVWYRAQVLPLPKSWAKKFESSISNYLWKGKQFKNLLSMESICQPCENGGLNLPYLRAKCDALLIKQMLRMLVSRRGWFDHLIFWINDVICLDGYPTFIHLQKERTGNYKQKRCIYFDYLAELYSEAKLCERFSVDSPNSATTKLLYSSLTETMPPHPVTLRYPDRDFSLSWKRLCNGVLGKTAKNSLFLLVYDSLKLESQAIA